jgi:bacterioferritin-associated ferredoxin
VNRVYVCHCFGITEAQLQAHRESGACTPRDVASACKAGTDCGSCVRRIQALLGRGAGCAPGTSRPSGAELRARLTLALPPPAVAGQPAVAGASAVGAVLSADAEADAA